MILAYDIFINNKHEVFLELYEGYDNEIIKIVYDYTKYFESVIKKYPEQYFWLHKRWNTKKVNNIEV